MLFPDKTLMCSCVPSVCTCVPYLQCRSLTVFTCSHKKCAASLCLPSIRGRGCLWSTFLLQTRPNGSTALQVRSASFLGHQMDLQTNNESLQNKQSMNRQNLLIHTKYVTSYFRSIVLRSNTIKCYHIYLLFSVVLWERLTEGQFQDLCESVEMTVF